MLANGGGARPLPDVQGAQTASGRVGLAGLSGDACAADVAAGVDQAIAFEASRPSHQELESQKVPLAVAAAAPRGIANPDPEPQDLPLRLPPLFQEEFPDEFQDMDMEMVCFLMDLTPELRLEAMRSMPREEFLSLPVDIREQFLAEAPEFAAELLEDVGHLSIVEDMGPEDVIASLSPKTRLNVVIDMAQQQKSDAEAAFVADEFNEIRRMFLRCFGEQIFQSVASLGWMDIDMQFAPVDGEVQRRFMSNLELEMCFLSPALHGTRPENLESIYAKGLLVGGDGVGIAHGATHGKGVYVANLDNPRLSLGFTYGSNKLLVCGVLHQGQGSPMVHSHGNAKVIKNSSHVVPLFLVSSMTHRGDGHHPSLHPQSAPEAPADPSPVRISSLFSAELGASIRPWARRTAQALNRDSVRQLRDAGFSATELRDGGFVADEQQRRCCFECSLAMDASALKGYQWVHPDNGDEAAEATSDISCDSCGKYAGSFYCSPAAHT